MQRNLNSGVMSFLRDAYYNHAKRFQGQPPQGFYIHPESIKDLYKEIGMVLPTGFQLEKAIFMNVPVYPSHAEAPYLRNHFNQVEIL